MAGFNLPNYFPQPDVVDPWAAQDSGLQGVFKQTNDFLTGVANVWGNYENLRLQRDIVNAQNQQYLLKTNVEQPQNVGAEPAFLPRYGSSVSSDTTQSGFNMNYILLGVAVLGVLLVVK